MVKPTSFLVQLSYKMTGKLNSRCAPEADPNAEADPFFFGGFGGGRRYGGYGGGYGREGGGGYGGYGRGGFGFGR